MGQRISVRPIVVDEHTAAWVAATVLTSAYIKSCGDLDLIRRCRCEYGSCGHCSAGDHSKCAHRSYRPGPGPETHVVGRRGSAYTPVWPATGPGCRWLCSCETCVEGTPSALRPVERRPGRRRPAAMPDQLAFF
jgi:hypothetical protein